MLRAICVTAAVLAVAGTSGAAQNRDRNDFGRSDWCDDDNFGGRRRATDCRVVEETLRVPQSIDVDAGQNGGISVRGWDRDDVHVRAKISASARTADAARDIGDSIRIVVNGGRIRANGPANESWSVSFEVQVPRNARLTLRAHNGGISLADFSGSAEFSTHNGGVSVADVSGDIQGRTQNGGVRVALTGRQWDGRGLDLQTTNGGVSVSVPDGYSAELETGTVNGGLRIDFPITLQGPLDRRHITTTLGSGGARIRALTTNGGVTVMRK